MRRMDRDYGTMTSLLLSWQSTNDEHRLELLLERSRGLIEGAARRVLHCQHINDPSAVDDAVALVFDHLRRLPGQRSTGRPVKPFRPDAHHGSGEPGTAYVIWLAKERARDVARAIRSRARRMQSFSQLAESQTVFGTSMMPPAENDADPTQAAAERSSTLHGVLDRLDPPLASVLRMLLAGKSQAAIAVALHVCEGTVSRMRARAIHQVRSLMKSD